MQIKNLYYMRKSIFYKIFLFYIILIILVFSITIALNSYYSAILEDDAKSTCNSALNNISDTINTIIVEIYNTNRLLLLDQSIYNHILFDNVLQPEDYYNLTDCVNSLKKLRMSKSFIDSVYIFNKSSNMVISCDGTFNADFFYNRAYIYNEYPFDFWQNLKLQHTEYTILNTSAIQSNSMQKKINVIPFVQSQIGESLLKNLFIININESEIINVMTKHQTTPNSLLFITDSSGNIVSSNNSEKVVDIVKNSALFKQIIDKKQGSFIGVTSNQKILISVKTSSVLYKDYVYVICVPLEEILSRSYKIRNLALMFSVCSFIFLAIVCYFISKLIYNPIKNLVNIMINNNASPQPFLSNEFEFLKNEFAKIIAASKNLDKDLNAAIPIVQEQFLLKLLNNDLSIYKNESEDNKKYYLKFKYNNFMVVIIDLDFKEKFFETFSSDLQLKFYSGIINIFEYLMPKTYNVYNILLESNKLCLIIDMPDDEINENMEKTINEFHNICHIDRQYVQMFIGIGLIHSGLEGVHRSFKEAKRALTTLSPFSCNYVCIYIDDKRKSNYTLTVEEENKIFNFLFGCKGEEVEKLLKNIIQRNTNDRLFSANLMDLYMQLYMIGLRVLKAKNIDPAELVGDFISLTSAFSTMTANEIILYIDKFYKSIIMLGIDRSSFNLSEVKEFIDQNYHKDIYLNQLADKYHTTAPHLSKQLHTYIGMSFQQYISKRRIDEAKQLLKTALPVNSIIEKVGFNNRNTFIRMFKKMEGMTPSEFRDMNTKSFATSSKADV